METTHISGISDLLKVVVLSPSLFHMWRNMTGDGDIMI